MKKVLKSVCTGLLAGAVILSGASGLVISPDVMSAATVKPPTVDQMIAKLTATSKTLKSFHWKMNETVTLQSGGMTSNDTGSMDLDINRLPKFVASGSAYAKSLDLTFGLFANDKEFYQLVDGGFINSQAEEATADPESAESGEELFDPEAQYWLPMEQEDWDTLYSKSQFDPGSVLDSVKNYKKFMKVTNAGTQTVLQFTITEPNAAKALIQLYDRDNLEAGATVQPKTVTWKLYANSKTWQTEKLTVDLNYTLVKDAEKNTYTTKTVAVYSNHNKVANIVKPAELE
ncbi:DUF6612 family protein [Paenibacillus sp. sgz500958]|uniref:DUF6612 family protein n=1 Tax=Paenibacillus sp. sgz500958 TaxID=3242475 RepID=UPI0036D2A744